MAPRNDTILCCDGGGIRGLLTAMLLNGLPRTLVSNTRVFAGTSTGGILSIGMAAGIPLPDLVKLYSSSCSKIFVTTPAASDDDIQKYINTLVHNDAGEFAVLWALVLQGYIPRTVFSAKWSNADLKAQLQQTLGSMASKTFRDILKERDKHLLVTTFQLDQGKGQWAPISIDTLGSHNDTSTLLDAAMATSAAPTYFQPYPHPNLGYCVDGGTYANNPSTLALTRALQFGAKLEDIYILSVGTGANIDGVPTDYFNNTVAPNLWGMLQWMLPLPPENPKDTVPSETLISLLMDGSSDIDDEQTAALLPKGHYLRIQVDLEESIALDNCEQVGKLQGAANKFMATQQWKDAVSWVQQNWV